MAKNRVDELSNRLSDALGEDSTAGKTATKASRVSALSKKLSASFDEHEKTQQSLSDRLNADAYDTGVDAISDANLGIPESEGIADSIGDFVRGDSQISEQEKIKREPKGFISGALDFLARGQYASAAVANTLVEARNRDGITGAIGSLTTAVRQGIAEVIDPELRLSYSDVLRNIAPDIAKDNPISTEVVGFIFDVALDPATYLTAGAGLGVKIGTAFGHRVLTKSGAKVYRKVSQKMLAKAGGNAIEAGERAEKIMVRLIKSNPALAVDEGLNVGFKIPLVGGQMDTNKFMRAVDKASGLKAGTTKNKLAEVTGYKAIKEYLGPIAENTAIVQTFNGIFRKSYNLPTSVSKAVSHYINDLDMAQQTVGDFVQKLVLEKGLTKDSSEKIAKGAHAVEDFFHTYTGPPMPAHQKTAVINDILKKNGMNDKEISAYGVLRWQLDDIHRIDKEAGLATTEWAEYMPRYYAQLNKPSEWVPVYKDLKRSLYGTPDEVRQAQKNIAGYKHDKRRVYNTLDEAMADGFVPEYNAMLAFTNRYLAQKRLLARRDFDKAIEPIIDMYKKQPKVLASIKREMVRVGRMERPGSDLGELNLIVRAWDAVTSVFKTTATVHNPAFSVFNLSSNRVQRALVEGLPLRDILGNSAKAVKNIAKTMGFFDPRSRTDAVFFMKNLDNPAAVANATLDTAIGTQWKGPEILEMLHRNRIVQGRALFDVGSHAPPAKKLATAQRFNKIAGRMGLSPKATKGFFEFVRNNMLYWRWPSKVEDYGRTSAFINALRAGHTEEMATQLTNKALFDYSNGLTLAEQEIIKRIQPFYSFNRFALPMLIESAVTNPGRIANTRKTLELAFSGIGKFAAYMTGRDTEPLTDAERYAIPGWLMEQPHAYGGYDAETKEHIFYSFNNYTPLDTLNFIESDEKTGKTSLTRTMQKTILAQLAPQLKTPLELAANKNMFTDRVIRDAYRIKDRLGEQGTITEALDNVLPQDVKKAIGWEIATDPRSGKRMVYINPYMSYLATNFVPVVKKYIRITDARLTPTERFLSTFGNMTTYKINLHETMRSKLRQQEYQIKEKQDERRTAIRSGLDESAEEYKDQLRELIAEIGDERKANMKGGIR